jgi:hypothetical protein
MSKSPSRLEGGLIARKGEAAPTTVVHQPVLSVETSPAHAAAPSKPVAVERSTPKGIAGTIAVTVRLDPERYERLKIYGAKQRQSNQQILVAALDAYL